MIVRQAPRIAREEILSVPGRHLARLPKGPQKVWNRQKTQTWVRTGLRESAADQS